MSSRYPRVYSTRKYSRNPLFRVRPRRRVVARLRDYSWKGKTVGLVLAALAGVTIWGIFYNSYFTITDFIIQGGGYIEEGNLYALAEDQATRSRWFILPQKNIFAFSKKELQAAIQNRVFVEDLVINKNLPRTVIISFKEKNPQAVWQEGERYYYLDEQFRVLTEVTALPAGGQDWVTLRNDELGDPLVTVKNGIRLVDTETAYNTLAHALVAHFNGREEKYRISNAFAVKDTEATLIMDFLQGPNVYFNIETDAEQQLRTLDVLLQERFKDDSFGKAEYIDLRFGKKVYYK